jgi:ABC-2 type transport system permease protein
MKKILLITQKEYLQRVRKKVFIIGTLLLPLLYLGLIFGTQKIAEESKDALTIGIYDESGLFTSQRIIKFNGPKDIDPETLVPLTKKPIDIAEIKNQNLDGYIVIPKNFNWANGDSALTINTAKTFGLGSFSVTKQKLNDIWKTIRQDSLQIDAAKELILAKRIEKLNISTGTNQAANANRASAIGYACGFLMYLILLLYGSQVMMAVTEEKTTRVAEIIVSSVKPFELMMGKIIGIVLVALTQVAIWLTCIILIYKFAEVSGKIAMGAGLVAQLGAVINGGNFFALAFCFVFYLLGGLLFYSSLYAAIGSTINEDLREAQSLSFPITLLIIFSIALMSTAIANPNSSIATWASIVPFSSPIVMMARVPFGVPSTVPYWQLGLSMFLLVASFVTSTWLAGKIFRTGILMYGKKPSWKQLLKWAVAKN